MLDVALFDVPMTLTVPGRGCVGLARRGAAGRRSDLGAHLVDLGFVWAAEGSQRFGTTIACRRQLARSSRLVGVRRSAGAVGVAQDASASTPAPAEPRARHGILDVLSAEGALRRDRAPSRRERGGVREPERDLLLRLCAIGRIEDGEGCVRTVDARFPAAAAGAAPLTRGPKGAYFALRQKITQLGFRPPGESMAEPHRRESAPSVLNVPAACTLCGEPTVARVTDGHQPVDWPREYPCGPACAYGVDDADLYHLLRVAVRGRTETAVTRRAPVGLSAPARARGRDSPAPRRSRIGCRARTESTIASATRSVEASRMPSVVVGGGIGGFLADRFAQPMHGVRRVAPPSRARCPGCNWRRR
jgi:hypothetical protein